MPKKLLFENVECYRCCGSGRYGPVCVYGGVCFKCRGAGAVLTKRGSAAQQYLNELRQRRYDEFKPGDLIFSEGFVCGSFSQPSYFTRVVSVAKKENGNIILYTEKGSFEGQPSSLARAGFSGSEKDEQKKKALAYQATLGKNGKVMKKFEKAAAMEATLAV